MDKDLDKKLYNNYLNGEKEAFEILYNKYKSKIEYFIFNIVKDYQKAEDIAQETFIYVMENKMKEKVSFKYYIYLVAKSKAINYINVEKRRNEIIELYLSKDIDNIQNDVLDTIEKEETKKELLDAIELLDDKYKNAIYLVNIERLSYEETSKILGETLQNTKNLIHRGKKQLRKILLKKGFDEMNKVMKVFIIILCISIILSGFVYATIKIIENIKGKAEMTPTYTSGISSGETSKLWVGTFNLVWNDFMDDVIGGKIEFEDGYSALADELNKQSFTEEQLNKDSYYKTHGTATFELRNEIESNVKQKFNEESKILDEVEWGNPEAYVLYTMLKKEFNYLEPFPTLKDNTFGDSDEKVKYFGLEPDRVQDASKSVEILFYNSKEDFAIKLKTKEGEEVYLYRTTGENKSFEENYSEMQEKESNYTGDKTWNEDDVLNIPFIKISNEINYDELCNRFIKGTNWYIRKAIQTVDFELNNYGGSVKSEALIEALKQSVSQKNREFIFNDDFILYLKEEDKEKPYLALKVDSTDVLVSAETN